MGFKTFEEIEVIKILSKKFYYKNFILKNFFLQFYFQKEYYANKKDKDEDYKKRTN